MRQKTLFLRGLKCIHRTLHSGRKMATLSSGIDNKKIEQSN